MINCKGFLDPNIIKNQPVHSKRPWGNYTITFAQAVTLKPPTVYMDLVTKVIIVNPGEILSYQKHLHRNETWKIIQGTAIITLNGVETEHSEGDTIEIKAGVWHRIANPRKRVNLIFQEIITGKYDEDDIERRDDKYGRDSNWSDTPKK